MFAPLFYLLENERVMKNAKNILKIIRKILAYIICVPYLCSIKVIN
jgi:hypothetical protein